jgi:amidophosphoribosyltransferase
MPSVEEFIAHNRTEEEIGQAIGADKIFYQELDDLVDAVRQGNPKLTEFDTSCFNAVYPTGGVDAAYLAMIDEKRNNAAKAADDGVDVEDVEA